MKALILAPNIDIMGGANVLVFKIARYLASKGDEVQIWSNFFYSNKRSMENALFIRNIGKEFSDVIILKRMLGILSYLTLPAESNTFDIMFCHNFPSYFSTLSSNFNGSPTIWQCNEPSIVLYPLPTEVVHPSAFDNPSFTIPQNILRRLDRLAVSRITQIAVLSQYAKNRVKLLYDRDSEIIRLGVDTNRFKPSYNGDDVRTLHGITNRPIILTVGRLEKRVDLVLKAIATVKKTIGNVVYVIAGPCDDPEIELRLHDQIKQLRLESNVIITGPISNELLPHYYASCDIFVFPQPHWSWGLTAIEAMSTGKPVIVPDRSGISEIILDGVNGIKVPIENTELLAKAMINLLKDESMRRNMGTLAREYVVKHLQESQFLDRYYELLKKLVM